jgi:hypothetical protein
MSFLRDAQRARQAGGAAAEDQHIAWSHEIARPAAEF